MFAAKIVEIIQSAKLIGKEKQKYYIKSMCNSFPESFHFLLFTPDIYNSELSKVWIINLYIIIYNIYIIYNNI